MGASAKFGTQGLLNACGVVVRLFEGDVARQAQVHLNGYDATDATRVQVVNVGHQLILIHNALDFVFSGFWKALLKQFARG